MSEEQTAKSTGRFRNPRHRQQATQTHKARVAAEEKGCVQRSKNKKQSSLWFDSPCSVVALQFCRSDSTPPGWAQREAYLVFPWSVRRTEGRSVTFVCCVAEKEKQSPVSASTRRIPDIVTATLSRPGRFQKPDDSFVHLFEMFVLRGQLSVLPWHLMPFRERTDEDSAVPN